MRVKMNKIYQRKKLGTIILIWLIIILLIASVASSVVGLLLQDHYQKRQAFSVIRYNLVESKNSIDVTKEYNSYFDGWMDEVIDQEGKSRKDEFCDDTKLKKISEDNRILFIEISIADTAGTITYSSDQALVGTNIKDREDLAGFACLPERETSYSDDLNLEIFTGPDKVAHVGKAFKDKSGFVLFGINKENYLYYLAEEVELATADSRIGLSGYIINCDMEKNISGVTYNRADLIGETFPYEYLLPENEGEIKETTCTFYGEKCYVGALKTSDYYIIGAYPIAEAAQFQTQNNTLFASLLVFILAVFFASFFIILKKLVIKGVEKTHASLSRIIGGDFEEKVNVTGALEFEELSQGINQTVDKLTGLIRAEEEHVKNELLNARYIQESAVPGTFPPYPGNEAFGLFAYVRPAKNVGGDFYDFFMTDDNTLAIVMADVSEKGMPAALYMMRAKTLIKTYAERGLSVEEVAAEVNRKLCEDGATEMFVTAWIGFLDIPSGVLSYVHAGHTLPILIGKEVSFVKQKINAVLGGFKKAGYVRQEVRLSRGDSLFLYTDGVTEAHDPDGNMYTDDRLLELISKKAGEIDAADRNEFCREGCEMVLTDVDRFVSDAEQYDDITMLWLKYTGQ